MKFALKIGSFLQGNRRFFKMKIKGVLTNLKIKKN